MTTHFHHMPVDLTKIRTRLRIHADLSADPNAYIDEHDLPIRTSNPSKKSLTLKVLNYQGIKLKLSKDAGDRLTKATIDFNPCVCLHGHNGYVLTVEEFLDALAILVASLKPLLHDPDDWVDLIPGLRSGGIAYWHYLELHSQYDDSDGSLYAAFRQAVPDKPRIPVRHWPTSMRIGGDKSDRLLKIYLKAPEMVTHGKLGSKRLSDYKHVLRLEMRLKGGKLVTYLGNERNVEVIDGKRRLVAFYPVDLFDGLRIAFGALQGVYSSDPTTTDGIPNGKLVSLGRLLTRVALDPRSPLTFVELVERLTFYTGAKSGTMGPIKRAGGEELSRLSTISKDDLFSDAAFQSQHHVASEELEAKVLHEIEDTFVHCLISKAYRPPDQPFQPMTRWPGYIRAHRQADTQYDEHETR